MSDIPLAERRAPVCNVYHGTGSTPESFTKSRAEWRPADELLALRRHGKEAAVLLVDASMLDRAEEIRKLPSCVIVVANDVASEQALGARATLSVAELARGPARSRVLRAACAYATASYSALLRKRLLTCARRDLHELKTIGMGLMYERDQGVLLRHIVEQGKLLTESDAGCLFLLEKDQSNVPRLRPALYVFDSLEDVPALGGEALPVDNTSIIGYAATVKHHVVVDDTYALPPDAEFQNNPDFERRFGYYVRSILIVPMIDHRDSVVGVLVFVNRKSEPRARVTDKASADRYVLTYTRREVRLARALASVAAASIENTTLYAQIEHIFESFVKAAVSAIDQRDPTTSGHSVRVATLTTELAAAVQRGGTGMYRHLRFTRQQMRELHFAALLHDLGKVGVREDLLMKGKKLPTDLWARVDARFGLIRRTMESEYYRKCATLSLDQDGRTLLEAEFKQQTLELERLYDIVRSANEPADLEYPPAELDAIASRTFPGTDGSTMPYLTADELRYLQIPHGTLDERERGEIQSHVEQTYHFLLQIPWTDDLKNLALYAYGHHEKLDGSGYPRRIKGDQIPVQTRLMTIADIFDALTASDRPYKSAVSPDKALDVIQSEARAGMLDPELVRVMVESRVYQRILETS